MTTFHGSDSSGHVQWQRVVSLLVARRSTPIFVSPHLAERLHIADPIVIPTAVDTELFRPLERSEARRALRVAVRFSLCASPGGARKCGEAGGSLRRRSRPRAQRDSVAAGREPGRALPRRGRARHERGRRDRDDIRFRGLAADRERVARLLHAGGSLPVGDVATQLAGLEGCAIVERQTAAIAAGVVKALRAGRPRSLRARAVEYSRLAMAKKVLRVYMSVLTG